MKVLHSPLTSSRATGWLAVAIMLSMTMLAWLGYRGILQWQRSTTELAARRVDRAADLLASAIARDMRSVQTSILDSTDWVESLQDPGYELRLRQMSSRAFALYPYPETFFAWRDTMSPDSLIFFHRSDRTPSWSRAAPTERAPVIMVHEHKAAQALVGRISADIARGQRYAIFDFVLSATPYQVVVSLLYRDEYRENATAGFGFLVNQHWVEEHYFSSVAEQVGALIGEGVALSAQADRSAFSRAVQPSSVPGATRNIPRAFFDPSLVALHLPPDLDLGSVSAHAAIIDDPLLLGARTGAFRTLAVATAASIVLAIGLLLSVRATRAEAALAAMRSDFVSTVTHEIKTPLAGIRALAETLASGRISSNTTPQEYANLVVQEAKRLTRLVDNLLAYSRITDVADVYTFEDVEVDTLVFSTVQQFQAQLKAMDFNLHVMLPNAGLPSVRGDRVALGLLLDNLMDNAINYSRATRDITIRAEADSHEAIVISIADKGIGIPVSELEHVTARGFRGRYSGSVGSGIGLAISRRIAADHGGSLTIKSELNKGTAASVTLPVAQSR